MSLYRVEVSEVRWQGEVISSVSNTGFDSKWPELLMRQLG
jgi:hypothetical protein